MSKVEDLATLTIFIIKINCYERKGVILYLEVSTI